MTHTFFDTPVYTTPTSTKRALGDVLALGSSLYFNTMFLKIMVVNRQVALKNRYNRARWASSSFEIFRLLEKCGCKFTVEGLYILESVKDEPVVFVSNHMGTMETMIFPGLIAAVKEVTFVVKESLTSNFLFGPIMRARTPITVGRTDSRKDLMTVISEGTRRLSEGTSVVIFPQSTRTTSFVAEEFNSLGIKLAAKAGVRVVPIAIKTDFWGMEGLVKDLGTLNRNEKTFIKFGDPISVSGTGKEQHQHVISFIEENLRAWGSIK
jgi:1-acyl-sn-glycerol-3-phosphate acyltransferase